MRIALVSTPYVAVPPRAYGGTELVVHELLKGLVALGHDVTLFATGDSDAPDLRYVYDAAVWPPDPEVEAKHCAAAAETLARERFDVIHAHVPGLLPWAPRLAAPVVYTIHHDHDAALTRLYARHPEVRYVAISARQARLEPELACEVVHHGLDPARYPAGEGDGGYALFLGRLSPCKGPDLAIAAARRAGMPIRVAGRLHRADDEPGWRDSLGRALEQPGVEALGPIGGARKRAVIGAAVALLMPLRWEEPFGLVMIEAMLCGTPVIAFPRGAAPELVEDGVTGFLVEDIGEMARALAGIPRFDRPSCRRRARQRFSTARMARDYDRIYRSAAAAASVPLAGEGEYAG